MRALANGINTNLLRCWVKEHRESLLVNSSSRANQDTRDELTTVVPVAMQNSGMATDYALCS
ncbi:protein of unknown function [Georgfuchsia toluolica]|uniref:Uncharacterized protein n=1 Tax=Georgfuchsia toluolica TaxID=424218 RepID=A0A916MZT8_9PROT|nr:protein of unknown function [Georgfuchsia toluolica]